MCQHDSLVIGEKYSINGELGMCYYCEYRSGKSTREAAFEGHLIDRIHGLCGVFLYTIPVQCPSCGHINRRMMERCKGGLASDLFSVCQKEEVTRK